jgi:hypothetical protein
MKMATLKLAASGLMLAVLSACGGGGSTATTAAPTFDYSKLNRVYRCTAVVSGKVEVFNASFSASNLKVTIVSSNESNDVNDIVGTANGFPRYSEKIAGTDEAVTFFFFTDGALGYGRGKVSGIENLVFDGLQTSVCAKS